MFIGCNHLRELSAIQRLIIERHIERHKWFQHIADDEQAIADFIEKFAWIMREFHCTQICPDRSQCDAPVLVTGDQRLPYVSPRWRTQHFPPERGEILTCMDPWARAAWAIDPESGVSVLARCRHLDTLLESQADIISRHMARHMWFKHIVNRDEALRDFVNEFGWVMRELYCGQLCAERLSCGVEALHAHNVSAPAARHCESPAP